MVSEEEPFRKMLAQLTTTEEARDLSVTARDSVSSDSWQMNLVYGEFGPEALIHVFERFATLGGPTSSFLDVGSGAGKVLVAASMLGDFTAAVGIEIIQSLHEAACRNVSIYHNSVPQRSTPDTTINCILGDALSEATYIEHDMPLGSFLYIYCNSTMFTEEMMDKLSKLPFVPDSLCCTATNKLDDARWEQLDSWCEESSGNWGGKTTFFMWRRRTKREASMRLMAKKMSGVK